MLTAASNHLVAVLLLAAAPPASAPEVEPAVEDEADELICRRKLEKSDRVGERFKSTKICKTREEWEKSRRR